jgi:hypothetical protein
LADKKVEEPTEKTNKSEQQFTSTLINQPTLEIGVIYFISAHQSGMEDLTMF